MYSLNDFSFTINGINIRKNIKRKHRLNILLRFVRKKLQKLCQHKKKIYIYHFKIYLFIILFYCNKEKKEKKENKIQKYTNTQIQIIRI